MDRKTISAESKQTANEAALREMLERIVNRATRPINDSCGQPMVSIRKALLDQARELLAAVDHGTERRQ